MRQVNGQGTIQQCKDKEGRKRPGVWRVRFNLGRDQMTGKYLYSPWRTVRGTKTDARKAAEEYRRELEQGISLDANCTFAQYATGFQERRALLGNLAPSTQNYEVRRIRRLIKEIGSYRLQDIDCKTIEDLIAKLCKDGSSAESTRRLIRVLKQICNDAMDRDYLTRNPCDRAKLPKVEKHQMNYLKPEELGRFLAALEAPVTLLAGNGASLKWMNKIAQQAKVTAVRVALATGARRGEVLGLTWEKVDTDKGLITIDQQQTSFGFRHCAKTATGNRVVAVDGVTVEKLKAWKLRQAEYLLRLGIAQKPDIPVITNEAGDFHDPAGFSRWWRDFTKYNGFEGLRFHDLRHTQATLLIASGADIKTVQARLGHADASTTLNLYAHALPGKDREAADTIGALLDAKQGPSKVVNL